MDNRSYAIPLIIGILFGSVAGYFTSNALNQQTLKNQETQIHSLTQTLTELNNTLIETTQELTEKEETINHLEESISTLTNELVELQTTIEDEPRLLEEKENLIDVLQDELKAKQIELIRQNERLGDRLDWKKYDAYDISFEYPEYMDLSKIDNGYYNGEVFYLKHIDPLSYVCVFWMDSSDPFSDSSINETVSEFDELDFQEMITLESNVNGHEAYIIHYTVSVGDGSYHGILGLWQCEQTGRIIAFLHYTSGDPLTLFFNMLSTFQCHQTGVSS